MKRYAETKVSESMKGYLNLRMSPKERVIRAIEHEGFTQETDIPTIAKDSGTSYQTAAKWASEYFENGATLPPPKDRSKENENTRDLQALGEELEARNSRESGGAQAKQEHSQEPEQRQSQSTPQIEEIVAKIAESKFKELAPELMEELSQVETLLKDAQAQQPKVFNIQIPQWGKDVKATPDDHEKLPDLLRLAAVHKQVWLCGPTGSGKTFAARQLAEKLEFAFGAISCTEGMSETHIIGRRNPFTDEFFPSEFLNLYENGGVFLLDEADAADANVMVKINSAIANSFMSVETRNDNPIAKRHDDFILILATNTWGSGQTGAYSARGTMDLATRDRFALSKLYVGYSYELERKLVGDFERKTSNEEYVYTGRAEGNLCQILENMRHNVERNNIRRAISTRTKIGAQRMLEAGFAKKEILSILLQDWTQAERAKVLTDG